MGSNHRPHDYQSRALPTELPEHVAEGVGFEPTEAFVSQIFRTSALNRSAIPPYGSHGWNRTNLPRLTAPTNKFVGFQVGSLLGYTWCHCFAILRRAQLNWRPSSLEFIAARDASTSLTRCGISPQSGVSPHLWRQPSPNRI